MRPAAGQSLANIVAVLASALLAPAAWAETDDAELLPFAVVGDAIPEALGGKTGDPARGRAIVVDRRTGLCLLCHSGPFPDAPFQGNLAPDLAGAGQRWTAGQLRLRLVDGRRIDPTSIMPGYYRTDGLTRLAPDRAGQTLLSAQAIEDVVAFLVTLRP